MQNIVTSNLGVKKTDSISKKSQPQLTNSSIRVYPMCKVRYNNDRKLPFEILADVPYVVKKSLVSINMKKIPKVKDIKDFRFI